MIVSWKNRLYFINFSRKIQRNLLSPKAARLERIFSESESKNKCITKAEYFLCNFWCFYKRSPNDIYFEADGILASITIKDFLGNIGGSWENAVKKSQASHEVIFFPNSKIIVWLINLENNCAQKQRFGAHWAETQ